MPVPEAPLVVIKVTHPCYVSVLRAKLNRTLDIPLEEIRCIRYRVTVLTLKFQAGSRFNMECDSYIGFLIWFRLVFFLFLRTFMSD